MSSKLKEKFIVFILISISIIFIVSIFLKGTVLSESSSTNDKNIIIISYSSTSLLGPANINIKSKKSGLLGVFSTKNYLTQIFNDGKNLSESNVSVSWTSNTTAVISLNGEEQPVETIKVNFEPKISYVSMGTNKE